MPDEVGTEAARSDAPSVDDSLFGEAADDKTAAAVDEQDSTGRTEQDGRGSDETGEQDAETDAAQEPETAGADDLKVVLSIKGGRASIGVQKPSADPHIETFEDRDLSELAQKVLAVIERARARWEETPKHPAYERPAPPSRRRTRRGRRAAQASDGEGEMERTGQAQQQTLMLF